MESPHPIKVHEDSRAATIENHVACGKLLIAEICTNVPAVEYKITHVSARSILHENSLLSIVRRAFGSHIDCDILEAGGLCYLPVDAGGVERCICHINNKIADLSVEVVLVRIPLATTATGDIHIRVKGGKAGVRPFVCRERGID